MRFHQSRSQVLPACGKVAHSARPGFTLIEIIVVMSMLGVLTGFVSIALVTVLRVEGGSRAALDQLLIHAKLADQFREDVGLAVEAPERWQGQTAGPTCLILRTPSGRHIVYSWEDEQLFRANTMETGQTTKAVVLGKERGKVTFIRKDLGKRLLLLRHAGLRDVYGKPSITEIVATLGGEVR
jgi:prepilin-type N-terminal cleavage/methylation domain-containing protein